MIAESIKQLTVGDAMTNAVLTVESMTPTGIVLELMEAQQVSALPVVDGDRCVGIVTAMELVRLIRETNAALRSGFPHYEDCLWAVELTHRKLDDNPICEIMNMGVERVTPGVPLCEAAQRMCSSSQHHLVVEQDGQLLGFLSSWDVAAAIC
ncbi:CBS domain-containing protein [Stieleria sp. TO1_6]|uniref:CBS domain-containing protein n=1 Tax=Stieleria tagensis TaxID=2956795 RepID=UPI00209B5A04|nr:CBS domain-containing protein [Stieleria tagensis]MCO8120382.1 CBS domain-containing protein [Stieleria tagensis]